MPNAGQRYSDVVISGLAHLDAPQVLTSEAIEDRLAPAMKRLGVGRGLLGRLVGISQRRVWDEGTPPSDPAAEAGRRAIERSGVPAEQLGMLVNTSVSRDFLEPSTASIVHGKLGLPTTAMNFDLGNACLGFVNGMNLVSTMIERGEIDHGIVVNAESSRFVVESTIERLLTKGTPEVLREQFATLTLGSGAVAMVLSRKGTVDDGHAYLGGLSRASTQHAHLCTGHAHEMLTDLRGLLDAGIELGHLTWKEAVDAYGWDPDGFDLYALHQVSLVHTRAVCDTLGIDPQRVPLIFPEHGNMGPASVPYVLSKAAEEGRLRRGDKAVLMGIGSGLNACAAEVHW
ncbi:3-oxoacyl-ACP synthase III [Vallicoccus soli]|uniref:3-oxoacyl-ACP synthase III n=1 Tax=Vallicoccus soli TaxID=2339232 RepID=A0A3A3Z1E8_9ACTN|nr:3-oxoacyl-ACP synthase III [Vallicoccus soli]RJK94217.1 3-oxoacyl-ACP synthase III [Vallicoccus soli]